MMCPACGWEMRHTPKDELVQFTCKRGGCEYMATEEHMNSLTEDDITRIKKEIQETKRYREQQKANREIAAIERASKGIGINQTVHDVARKYKKMSSLSDFIKE